jgi:O-antigen/teichoic acid export membrane protein
MAEVALAFGQKLMQNGLSEPLIQIPHLEPEHSDTLFWTLQVLGFVLVGGIAAASGAIGAFFSEPAVPALVTVASLSLYFQACGLVPRALFARDFRFREAAQAAVAGETVGGIVGVTAALAGAGVWALARIFHEGSFKTSALVA